MEIRKKLLLRSIGAGIAISVPLILGLVFNNPKISMFGSLGAFSYLMFKDRSLYWNIVAISLHAVSLYISFILGSLTGMHSWSLPFVIGFISFVAFFLTKLYRIPKPDYFFVVVVFATGFNTRVELFNEVFYNSKFLLYGIFGALLSGVLISILMKLPRKIEKDAYEKFDFWDKYYVTIHKSPDMFLKACHFSSVLFITSYVSYLLKDYSGYWILVSSVAILGGEHLNAIKKRTIGRVIGTIGGLIFGFLLIKWNLDIKIVVVLIICFNGLIEYFVAQNYTLANFFINPQVLLLMSFNEDSFKYLIFSMRLAGVLIGSFLTMVLIFIMSYSVTLMNHYTIPKYYQDE